MYTVKLFNDVFHGPIWVIGDNGVVKLHYPLITEDKVLKSLSDEAGLLFASFTSEDLHDFDKAGYKAAYPKMKELVNKIIDRLNEINDGSFTIEDEISNKEWDKELKKSQNGQR
jgi:hypothetical protein